MYPTDQDIEDYIEGLLSASEMQKFEDALVNDEPLRERVELLREERSKLKYSIAKENNLSNFNRLGESLLDAKSEEEYLVEAQQIIDEDGLIDKILVKNTPEIEAELEVPSFQKKSPNSKVLQLMTIFGKITVGMAAIFFLLFILKIGPFATKPILVEQFASAAKSKNYFPEDFNQPQQIPKDRNRGTNEEDLQLIHTALKQMESTNPDYTQIAELWTDILNTPNPAPEAKFNYGLSLLLDKKYNEAILEFEQIVQGPNDLEKDQAYLNLIRAYLWSRNSKKVQETTCYYLSNKDFKYNRTQIEKLKDDLNIPCD